MECRLFLGDDASKPVMSLSMASGKCSMACGTPCGEGYPGSIKPLLFTLSVFAEHGEAQGARHAGNAVVHQADLPVRLRTSAYLPTLWSRARRCANDKLRSTS